MRSYLYVLLLFSILVLWSSCRKDFEYGPSSGNLEFSRDTVYLDTIFSNIGSSTYSFKVYNRTRDDILIPSIRLNQGQESGYRLNVDGVAGKEFMDVPILARDSLFVFVETTFDVSETNEVNFLYTDAVQFDSGSFLQEVQLVTLVKDAVFLYPSTSSMGTTETIDVGMDGNGGILQVEGFFLQDDQLNFTNEKPYVIYGYAAVPSGRTLQIDAGTRVHFHQDSGIYVSDNASLQVNGQLSTDTTSQENEVIFEGDRLEPQFENVPGQWGTIWLSPGSSADMDYLTIKNASIGMLVQGSPSSLSPILSLNNTQIHNSANINLWAQNADISAENCVLGSAGRASLYCNNGGSYDFRHCTIANYWTNGPRQGAALQIDNFSTFGASDLVKAHFANCIVDGNAALELLLTPNEINAFNFTFLNCLIKFKDDRGQFAQDPLYDFENGTSYQNIFLNLDTDFVDPSQNDFSIQESSRARDQGDIGTAQTVPLDIRGNDRTQTPDIGAYENSPNAL